MPEAFVSGYDYDVFVSYAQANDHDGWVSRFKEELTDFLNERLDNAPKIFWDEQSLKLNDDLDTTIPQAVRQSAVMVIVVSHKYLTRQWCSLERETFLQNGDERRVMIVRYDDVSFQDFQQVLPKSLGIEFFDDDCLPLETESREFKKRLHKLRMTIVEQLNTLREQVAIQRAADAVPSAPQQLQPAGNGSSSVSVDASEPLVFVAPVSPRGEMISRRDELTSFLKDCGINTVTPADYFFMQPDFAETMAADLERCDGFVQLLDVVPIAPPPNMPDGVERWFLTQARQREQLGVLRWRRAEPSAAVGDFHDLALEADVRPFEFARFCELVRDEARSRHQARRAETRLASTSSPPLLVLRADAEDESLGDEIAQRLHEQVDLMDIPPSNSLDEVAAQLPAGGLLVIFRNSREVLRRIQELRAFTASQAARHWVLGFWNSPEDPTKTIRLRSLKNVHVINDGDTAALSAFVDEMKQKGGQG